VTQYWQWRSESAARELVMNAGDPLIVLVDPYSGTLPPSLVKFHVDHRPVGIVIFEKTPKDDRVIDTIQKFSQVKRVIFRTGVTLSDAQTERVAALDKVPEIGIEGAKISPHGIAAISRMPRLERLYLMGSHINDASLESLKNFPSLKWVRLINTRVTDAGLAHLRGSRSISEIYIDNTPITDDGIEHLLDLGAVDRRVTLHLNGTKVTDAGVARLVGMKHLVQLSLRNTPVSCKVMLQLIDADSNLFLVIDDGPETQQFLSEMRRRGHNRMWQFQIIPPTNPPATAPATTQAAP